MKTTNNYKNYTKLQKTISPLLVVFHCNSYDLRINDLQFVVRVVRVVCHTCVLSHQ